MAVFHVDIESFMTVTESLRDRSLRDRPVLVAPPTPRATVLGASQAAKACGIQKGMLLSKAQRLCREARVLHPDYALYQSAHRHVVKLAARYSPIIEPIGYGHIALDMSGMSRLYPALTDAAARLRKDLLESTGLQATLGIAANKLVSTIAAKQVQHQGDILQSVDTGEEPPFLAPLPCKALPDWEDRSIRKLLFELNMQRIAQIQAVRQDIFSFALGQLARQLHQHALGIDPRPVTPPHAARELMLEHVFFPDTNDDQQIQDALYRMVEQLCFQLRARGLASDRVHVQLRYSDDVWRRHTYLYNRTQADHIVFHALRKQFTQFCDRRARVRYLALHLRGLVQHQYQPDLFEQAFGEKKRQALLDGMDVIRKRFGQTALQTGVAQLQAPEDSFQLPVGSLDD
ncbi:MAG: hypothetical protein H6510_14625 [Acidobacteria bacterium]|nr:hypothetical protein [Acidobacteriota bacterium]MCB9399046.1 hypothetical protein [Acidobacteriota bacterium]